MLTIFKRHRFIFSLISLGLGLVWIVISARGMELTDKENPAPQRGFLAPDFTLKDLSGTQVQLLDFKGYPLVVNFWATWCPPCQAEMPTFQKIYSEYKPQGLALLAVNTQEERSRAINFTKSHSLTFPILLDTDGSVADRYRIDSLPVTFFINKAGFIEEVAYGGPISEAFLRVQVEKLLKETP